MQIGSIISRGGNVKHEIICYQPFPNDDGHGIGVVLVGIRELVGDGVYDSIINPVVFYTEQDILNHFFLC